MVGWTVWHNAAVWLELFNILPHRTGSSREYLFLACQGPQRGWADRLESDLDIYHSAPAMLYAIRLPYRQRQ